MLRTIKPTYLMTVYCLRGTAPIGLLFVKKVMPVPPQPPTLPQQHQPLHHTAAPPPNATANNCGGGAAISLNSMSQISIYACYNSAILHIFCFLAPTTCRFAKMIMRADLQKWKNAFCRLGTKPLVGLLWRVTSWIHLISCHVVRMIAKDHNSPYLWCQCFYCGGWFGGCRLRWCGNWRSSWEQCPHCCSAVRLGETCGYSYGV